LDYENLSDDEIKDRLFNTMFHDFHLRTKVNRWLETDRTPLLFIRQHASLLAKYFSLKIEIERYQSYIKMTESVLPWLSGMSKTLFQRNNINDQFFQIQKYTNKQLKNSEKEFAIITEKLAKAMADQQQVMSSSSSEIDYEIVNIIDCYVCTRRSTTIQ
jgi:hypothetical protein